MKPHLANSKKPSSAIRGAASIVLWYCFDQIGDGEEWRTRKWILAPRGCRPKMTTMSFNYGPANRKPYAHSILFRCVERFEELVSKFGVEANPEWPNAQTGRVSRLQHANQSYA